MKKFLSRKLVAMLLGALITPLLVKLQAPPEVVDWILTTIVVYITGQSAVDAVGVFKGQPSQ